MIESEAGKKIKKVPRDIKPNECGILRWLIAVVLSLLGLCAAFMLVEAILHFTPFNQSGSLGSLNVYIKGLLSFAAGFWVFVLCLKKICHTPVKDFILGTGGRFNKRLGWWIGILYFLGFLLSNLIFHTEIQKNTAPGSVIAVSLVLSILFVWMQTSLEEFWFRGVIIRAVGKNKCRMCVSLVIAGLIASVAFSSGHFFNPEIRTQDNLMNMVFIALCYFMSGLIMFLSDLCVGDITPGLILHWVNNMYCFVVISAENSTGGAATLFICPNSVTGSDEFLRELVTLLPVIIFLIILGVKGRLPGLKKPDTDIRSI